ncbi:hypothetical protein ILUMI_07792 [Ignelater luminosus]|uniref:Transmembrane protein n=1 Tax=Ignelater luminosus TaxID=2038154 RepID=A0A8K0D373_IGNLU|nr:hypothetical protein ILUMI_07792 [Ignelater luminosus]
MLRILNYRKQLEKAYKLCPPCEGIVKATVQKQSCLLGLKFTELRKKGVRLLDLNSSHDGISKKTKHLFLMKLVNVILTSFAILNLFFILTKIDFSNKSLKRQIPKWLFVHVLTLKNLFLMALSTSQNMWEIISNCVGFNVLLNMFNNVVDISENLINNLLAVPFAQKTCMLLTTVWTNFNDKVLTNIQPELPKLENATLLCFVGVLLQFISLIWNEKNSNKRKIVCLLMWIILTFTNWKYTPKQYLSIDIGTLQVIASTIIIVSSTFTKKSRPLKQKKMKRISKRHVQKQESNHHLGQFSDCEDEKETTTIAANSSPKSPTSLLNISNTKPVFGHSAFTKQQNFNQKSFQGIRSTSPTTAKDSLNLSFTSAKSCISDFASVSDTASVFNNPLINHNTPDNKKDFDIDISLNRLHLGSPKVRKSPPINTFYMNHDIPRPKPVISPSKLKNVTQNSWVAGGFWRDSNGILLPLNNYSNLSRSSSQTSGFVSLEPNNYNSLPSSHNNSLCGDFECNSVLSEPAYCMMQGRNFATRVAYHNNDSRRLFYPVLNHEQMVYIAPCGFNNMFANKNISLNNNKFTQNLYKRTTGQPSFGVPNINGLNTYRMHKPDKTLKEWFEKDF